MTTIKAGYRITVVSWENDADNYNTVFKEGLSESDARFYAKLAKLLKNDYSNYDNRLCNMYDPSDSEIERLHEALIPVLREFGKIETEEYAGDHSVEFLSHIGLTGDFYTRVCSSFKVEYVPHDIELEDVTERFKT